MRYVIANWKMHGRRSEVASYANTLSAASIPADVNVVICPPYTLLADFADAFGNNAIMLGAQNGHPALQGAYTGEISMGQLADMGCYYVLIGHSERRALGESDADVKAKAESAQQAGLVPVICVGESLAIREAGQAEKVVATQLQTSCPQSGNFLVAYEPIWAIGTGLVPSDQDITAMHATIQQVLQQHMEPTGQQIPILYGGSVKPDNAKQLQALAGVDGVLVGGASLNAQDFLKIII